VMHWRRLPARLAQPTAMGLACGGRLEPSQRFALLFRRSNPQTETPGVSSRRRIDLVAGGRSAALRATLPAAGGSPSVAGSNLRPLGHEDASTVHRKQTDPRIGTLHPPGPTRQNAGRGSPPSRSQWVPHLRSVFRRNILRAAKAVSAKSLNTPSIPSL
jgi:hypothetical protein